MTPPRTAAPARRRSVLSVPGSDAHKTAKALASRADEVVLDLEDAVAAGEKDAARALVVACLRAAPPTSAALAVRINPPGSPWCHLDLVALGELTDVAVSVVVPKVESAGDLAFVDRLLDGTEARNGRPAPMQVQALVETAAGLAAVQQIAHASPRLDGLVIGYADLGASLGMAVAPDARPELWLPAQHAVLVAARSAGIAAVDGPHLGVGVDEDLRRSITRTRDLGFDGKWAIHPQQLDVLNEAFTPTPEQVAKAREVLAALDLGREDGAGAVLLDGQMLDAAVAVAARRLLARSA